MVTILSTTDKWSPAISLTGIFAALLKSSAYHSTVNSPFVRFVAHILGNSWNIHFM